MSEAQIACRSCKRPIEKGRNGLRRSRDFCDRCAIRHEGEKRRLMRPVRRPRRQREPNLHYGPGFKANALKVRVLDGKKCVRCDAYPALIGDHIIPLRLVADWSRKYGDDPHAIENLWTLCQGFSGIKTGIDRRAKKADFVGFKAAMRAFCGANEPLFQRFLRAAQYYKINLP